MSINAETHLVFRFERTASQLQALESITQAWHCGPEECWGYESVLSSLAKPGSLLLFSAVSEDAPIWNGAALVDVGPYSADLLYIYVRPEARKKKLGHLLMQNLFAVLAGRKEVEALFLEVRISNKAAQKLYDGLRMELIGTRKKYYANGEDALIYKAGFNGEVEKTRG